MPAYKKNHILIVKSLLDFFDESFISITWYKNLFVKCV